MKKREVEEEVVKIIQNAILDNYGLVLKLIRAKSLDSRARIARDIAVRIVTAIEARELGEDILLASFKKGCKRGK